MQVLGPRRVTGIETFAGVASGIRPRSVVGINDCTRFLAAFGDDEFVAGSEEDEGGNECKDCLEAVSVMPIIGGVVPIREISYVRIPKWRLVSFDHHILLTAIRIIPYRR